MKLYDILKVAQNDYDTYDNEFDATVTVGWIEDGLFGDDDKNYVDFCNGIYKKVEVVKFSFDDSFIVDWSGLINRNMEKFKAFTKENWRYQYEDDEDEFVYQWINEIQSYVSGYVSEDFYGVLVKFVETLE